MLAHELAHLCRGDLWTNWLLLAVRTLHWFNPVAWWTVRAMLAEREAACDELALTLLGETDRPAYAATIVELATNMSGFPLAPAMIPLFSSASRLTARVDRLLRFPSVARLPAPVAAALLAVIALSGLTDVMPAVADPGQQSASSEPTAAKINPGDVSDEVTTETELVTLRGRCVDGADDSAMPGVRVRLFKVEGRTAPIVEAGFAVTDDEGLFEFADFVAPRDGDANRLLYLLFAEADDRPVGMGGTWTLHESDSFNRKIHILRDSTTFSGTIVDSRGVPIAGAKVAQWDIDGRSTPGILSATTGADGRFEIERIPDFRKAFGREHAVTFTVSHPDYPITDINVPSLPADVEIILSDGCLVTGAVTDRVTGQPAAGAVVVATDAKGAEMPATTGGDGTFHMVLAEDNYTFRVDAKDRVCIALTDRECLAGEKMELPPLELIAGGFISGRVINAATGNPVYSGRECGVPLYHPRREPRCA